MKAAVPRRRFVVPDVEPCSREVWLEPKARRTHWLNRGNGRWPAWEKGPLRAIRCVVEHAIEHPARRVGIITVPSIAACLRVALGAPRPPDMPEEVADATRRLLAPVLAKAVGVRWVIGQYGDLGGLEAMASCGGLATLMDPIPNLGTAQQAAAYYRSTLTWEQYLETATAAELERAHGVLLHPRRFAGSWAVHVGTTLPGGYGWDRPDVAILRGRLRRAPCTMTGDELLAIRARTTIRALARAVWVKENTMTRYLNGSRTVPIEVAERLRKHAARSTPNSASRPTSQTLAV